MCARRTREIKNKNSRLTHNDACTHVHTRPCASMLILLLGTGYHGHLSLGGLIIRELFRLTKRCFFFSCLFGFGFPTTGLSSLFVELTDDGFLLKVEVTSEDSSYVRHIFCTCVSNVSVLQVATLEILIRISLSHRRSYSFTQLDQITVPVVLPAFPSPRNSS